MSAVQSHWNAVYRDKLPAHRSWHRAHLDMSLRLIDELHLPVATPAIDVGGGCATLVDDLLARGFTDLTVLDIAESALAGSRARLADASARVHWIVGDVVDAPLPAAHYGLWHDRAAFHFLVAADARSRYVAQAARAVHAGGYAVVAVFAADGPERCSGLPVCRYDAPALAAEFQSAFEWVKDARDLHATPWGAAQPFTYVVLRRNEPVSR